MNKQPVTGKALDSERLSALCYQLWMLQKAGVPLAQGIASLRDDASADWSRTLLDALNGALEQGRPLSDALRACGCFPDYLLRTVEIGERSGQLEQVLSELADFYRREGALRNAVRRAVTYPSLMALLIAVVFVILAARVLPVFLAVFDQLGLSLSPAAAALLRFGGWGTYLAGAAAALLALGACALLFLFRTKAGARLLRRRNETERAGQSALCVARSRFSSAMSLMLSSGLPFDEALARASELVGRGALAARLDLCRADMAQGASFVDALRAHEVFDGLQMSLLSAGFRAGVPAQAMGELARRSGEEADERLSSLLSRMEYGLVIVLCAAVGLVLLSVMLPLLGVLSSVGV